MMGRANRAVGTLVLDKSFPAPVGRIRRRTGLSTKDQMDRLKSCLQELWSQGRTEEINLFRDKKIDSSRVVRLVEFRERLDPNEELLQSPLFSTVQEWLEDHYSNLRTKTMVSENLKKMKELTPGEPTVSEIPQVLEDYKKSCRKRNVRQPFIHSRSL